MWKIEEGFSLDEKAPEWAVEAVRRYDRETGIELRAWRNKDKTQYQYLQGWGGDHFKLVYNGNFIAGWHTPHSVYAKLVEGSQVSASCFG
ncbi:hypothetical protein MVUOKPPV_CDS0017 [Klebsiella phage phi1_175008]|uniref:Uncharacterized protein n=1 Tax=Klebsiella phage phi1_175008 TaxID=3127744 RepID=A0ACD5FRL7_9CAUD